MRYCPFCRCKGLVDIPLENVNWLKRNTAKISEHNRTKNEWETAKAAGATMERTGSRGNTCERG